MTRSVLILTYHFPPSAASGSFRLLGFAEHLPKHGWAPIVVAPPTMPLEPVDNRLSERIGSAVAVNHVPFPLGAPLLLKKMAGKAVWLPFAFARAARIIADNRPDAILTSGPPHVVHVLGALLKGIYRIPWVADFRDPWVSVEYSRPLNLKDRAWYLQLERLTFSNADRVIANAPNAARLYASAYPGASGKIVVLTNGFDPRSNCVIPRDVGDVVRLLHAGEIYYGRNPLPLIDAILSFNRAREDGVPRLDFTVVGRSSEFRAKCAGELALRGCDESVHFQDQVSHEEILAQMELAHLNILLDTPGRKVGVPAKLYEYLGAGRPILALAESSSDTACVLKASGVLHRVAPIGDSASITKALQELVQEIRSGKPTEGGAERLRAYTRESIAGSLGRILEELASE